MIPQPRSSAAVVVDPTPRFKLSPWLYMQFMEPLGVTDGSVEAMWDHMKDEWRPSVVETTKELAPSLLRFGGCLSSYYRWREGIGPRATRVPMHNLLWGGIESNQVGLHEFVDFARQVGAEPFYCVNFESDGRQHWARPPKGGVRSAGPREAAEWVDYCNNPSNRERTRNGAARPFNLKLWQIGNETSYDPKGYQCDTAARRTIAFAKAMRAVDPGLRFIGWGDSGWAPRMLERAGEHLDYIAYHAGYGSTLSNHPPYGDEQFRRDPSATWEHLMTGASFAARKLADMRAQAAPFGMPLALTESHYSFRGRNRGDLLASWAVAVSYARILNLYQRNGDILKIATLADFCGTRWGNNAVMLTTPGYVAYLMPVARLMSLWGRYKGTEAVSVTKAPTLLDITASRRGTRVFLHVANTSMGRSVRARIVLEGLAVKSGVVHSVAVDPWAQFYPWNKEEFVPRTARLPRSREWTFPAASVSAVELHT